MAETISFSEADAAAQDAQEAQSTELVSNNSAPVHGNLLPAVQEKLHESGLEGEFTASDIKPPRINLVAKTSKLVDDGFTPGDVVFEKEVKLAAKDAPINVVVLSMSKGYQEDVEYGTEQIPRIFRTETEVIANGGSTEWGSPNLFRPIADITMLVEAPAGMDEAGLDLFPFEHDGKNYALAVLTAAKTSYNAAAKPIAQAAVFASRAGGIHTLGWTMTSKQKSNGSNTWYVPQFARTGKLSPEFIEFVESVKP